MSNTSNYLHIKTDGQLAEFCRRASDSRIIGFDTEFVSENRYRPQLCLLQVATENELAIVDTLEVNNTDRFWELIVSGNHVTIVHAAREEFLFCWRACGKRPRNLFDVQLAIAFVGMEYPCSYGNVISKVLGRTIDKGETRTDWRRRPLSKRQLDYALQDVVYLEQLYRQVSGQLEEFGRLDWYRQEIESWMASLETAEQEPQWQRVSGIAGLSRASLAIARELWLWRDRIAAERNKSPRRVLPDDLLVEISKRGSSEVRQLKAIRGLENRIGVKRLEPVAEAVQVALDLPSSQHPAKIKRTKETNLGLLGQFLTTALAIVCRNATIAPSLVGTAQDVRQLAAWKLGMIHLKEEPDLAKGWRAKIVGQVIERILDGQLAVRVENPRSEHPLLIEEVE